MAVGRTYLFQPLRGGVPTDQLGLGTLAAAFLMLDTDLFLRRAVGFACRRPCRARRASRRLASRKRKYFRTNCPSRARPVADLACYFRIDGLRACLSFDDVVKRKAAFARNNGTEFGSGMSRRHPLEYPILWGKRRLFTSKPWGRSAIRYVCRAIGHIPVSGRPPCCGKPVGSRVPALDLDANIEYRLVGCGANLFRGVVSQFERGFFSSQLSNRMSLQFCVLT